MASPITIDGREVMERLREDKSGRFADGLLFATEQPGTPTSDSIHQIPQPRKVEFPGIHEGLEREPDCGHVVGDGRNHDGDADILGEGFTHAFQIPLRMPDLSRQKNRLRIRYSGYRT